MLHGQLDTVLKNKTFFFFGYASNLINHWSKGQIAFWPIIYINERKDYLRPEY